MPEVPLTYPTTVPTQGGASPIHVDAPVEAFGGAVGAALSHLGQSVQSDSDRIWERATQIQDLQNRAEADKLVTEGMKQAGVLHMKFDQLNGLDRAKALPDYMDQMEKLRAKIGQSASNPMVQRFYDAESRRTIAQTIFNFAGSAGRAADTAALEALQNKIDMYGARAGAAKTEQEMNFYMGEGVKALGEYHARKGMPAEDLPEMEYNFRSKVYGEFGKTLVQDGKLSDAKEFQERHDQAMRPEARDPLKATYETHFRAIGSEEEGDKIVERAFKNGIPQVSLDKVRDQAEAKADEIKPGDAVFKRTLVARTEFKYRDQERIERDRRNMNESTLANIAATYHPRSMQELLAHEGASEAFNSLQPQDQKDWSMQFKTAVSKELYEQFDGMTHLEPDQQQAFLNISPREFMAGGHYPMTQPYFDKLMARRDALIKKGPQENPMVARAMSVLRKTYGQTMTDLDVFSPTRNPDAYNQFVGRLWGVIQGRMEGENGRPPTDKEIEKEIGPLMFKPTQKLGWTGYYTTRQLNEPDDAFKKAMNAEAKDRGLPELSDDDMSRAYGRHIMEEKYKKSNSSD